MKLKIILTALLSISLFNISCQQAEKTDGYVINGTIKGLDSGWVKLIENNYVERGQHKLLGDSVQIVNGAFVLKGQVANADMVMLQVDSKYYCSFMLENSSIKVELDVTTVSSRDGRMEPVVSGSTTHDMYARHQFTVDSIMTLPEYSVLNELRQEMKKAYSSKDEVLIKQYQEKSAKYRELSNERMKRRLHTKFQFVKDYPSSPVAPNVLAFQFGEGRMTKAEMKEYYPLFEGDAKNTAMYAFYTMRYEEIFKKLAEGSIVPDFTLTTIEGEELTLSKVEGKYILVDFWASWCGPCRASFPHIKEMVKKYGIDGFTVVAVCTSDTEEKWRKAVKEDKTTWHNVFDAGAKNHQYGPVAKEYGVPYLPTTFLIDENGAIIGRQMKGEKLEAKLKELIGH